LAAARPAAACFGCVAIDRDFVVSAPGITFQKRLDDDERQERVFIVFSAPDGSLN
jgi:hypothetical protein